MTPDSHDEAVRELFALRDADSRRRLVEIFEPLARRLALRFRGRGVATDDLLQVARLGLLNAIDRFDTDRGVKFTTYAGRTIVGEIKHHFRDQAWSLRVPRQLQNLWLETSDAVDVLSQKLARSPTINEIADHIGVEAEDVLEALDAGGAYTATSLERPVVEGDAPIGDLIGNLDPGLAATEEYGSLLDRLRSLPQREQTIVYLRFFEGRTQSEIAEVIGVSQVHVSRLLAKTLETLRTHLSDDFAE
jgi:RNA polymerase sigma-B factor